MGTIKPAVASGRRRAFWNEAPLEDRVVIAASGDETRAVGGPTHVRHVGSVADVLAELASLLQARELVETNCIRVLVI